MAAANDPSSGLPQTLVSPPSSFKAVTPSDTVDLPSGVCRGIYVGAAGNLAVLGAQDAAADAVTFIGVLAGVQYAMRCRRVMSTNTTASNLVALY